MRSPLAPVLCPWLNLSCVTIQMLRLDQGKVSALDESKRRLFRFELRELIGSPGGLFNHSYREAIISYVFNPIVLSPLNTDSGKEKQQYCLIALLTPTEDWRPTGRSRKDIFVFIDDDNVSRCKHRTGSTLIVFLDLGPCKETISEAHTNQLVFCSR